LIALKTSFWRRRPGKSALAALKERVYKDGSIGAARFPLMSFAKFFYFYFWHLAPLAEGEGRLQQK